MISSSSIRDRALLTLLVAVRPYLEINAPDNGSLTFDGTSWTSAEYNGATLTPDALGLQNGDTGTMRAVFLPFGSDAVVSASGTSSYSTRRIILTTLPHRFRILSRTTK